MTVQEIAEGTGITRNTLSKMLNQHGTSVRSENLDRLCAFFDCRIEQLVEYLPSVCVKDRCMALRAVCVSAAANVAGIQSRVNAMMQPDSLITG